MKREYTDPIMKIYVIDADERVTAACFGGSCYTQIVDGCSEILVGGASDCSCTFGTMNQGSA